MHVREAGTNLNTRYNQVRNKLHQHPTSNPLQAQNSSSKLQSHSNSNPHVPHLVLADSRTILPPNRYAPHSVHATDRIIPVAQSEPASSCLSSREKNGVSVANSTQTNSLFDRGNSQGSGHIGNNTASDRRSDGGSAQSEPASSCLSRRENNCVSFAHGTTNNCVVDSGSNNTPPAANTTMNDSVCDRGNNQSGLV